MNGLKTEKVYTYTGNVSSLCMVVQTGDWVKKVELFWCSSKYSINQIECSSFFSGIDVNPFSRRMYWLICLNTTIKVRKWGSERERETERERERAKKIGLEFWRCSNSVVHFHNWMFVRAAPVWLFLCVDFWMLLSDAKCVTTFSTEMPDIKLLTRVSIWYVNHLTHRKLHFNADSFFSVCN